MSPQRGMRADQLDHAHRFGLFSGEPSLISGRYFLGLNGIPGTSAFTNSNTDRLWASAFTVPRAMSIDRLAIEVTTLQAASLMRLGLYTSKANTEPGDLIVDGGTVDTSTTGVKEATVDVALQPGLYWTVWEQDTASIGLRARGASSGGASLGWSTPGNQPQAILYVTHTFGALPDPFGAPTGYFAASTVASNAVWARVV